MNLRRWLSCIAVTLVLVIGFDSVRQEDTATTAATAGATGGSSAATAAAAAATTAATAGAAARAAATAATTAARSVHGDAGRRDEDSSGLM